MAYLFEDFHPFDWERIGIVEVLVWKVDVVVLVEVHELGVDHTITYKTENRLEEISTSHNKTNTLTVQ